MKIIFGALLFLIYASALGQQNTLRSFGLKVLPVGYYTPEIGLAIEGFVYHKFYAQGADRASNVRVFAEPF